MILTRRRITCYINLAVSYSLHHMILTRRRITCYINLAVSYSLHHMILTRRRITCYINLAVSYSLHHMILTCRRITCYINLAVSYSLHRRVSERRPRLRWRLREYILQRGGSAAVRGGDCREALPVSTHKYRLCVTSYFLSM